MSIAIMITDSNKTLDAILECLNDAYDNFYSSNTILPDTSKMTQTQIGVYLIKESIHPKNISIALRFLQKEKLIEYSYDGTASWYSISFSGKILIENGGYIAQSKREANKDKIRNLERTLLTFGAVATGMYGIFEIARWALNGAHFLFSIQMMTAFVIFSFGIIGGLIISLIIKHLLSQKE